VRILLDTNILVSALLSANGPPGQILTAIKQNQHTLVSSSYLTDELRDVCSRKHLRERISREEVEDLVYTMESVGVVVTTLPEIDLSPDPKDNPVLATAVAGKAELIVSGDKSHLAALGQAQGIPILNPRDAPDRIQCNEQ